MKNRPTEANAQARESKTVSIGARFSGPEMDPQPNPDKPDQIATKAPRHKAKSSVKILFFEPLSLGGAKIFHNMQRNYN